MNGNKIAKTYIKITNGLNTVKNTVNNEHGTTALETMIVTVLLAVVVVICATALAGFMENSDAASNLLPGALGIGD